MAEKPIILRDWEVRAYLEGCKTQMRVPIRNLPPDWYPTKKPQWADGNEFFFHDMGNPIGTIGMSWVPPWQPGDRLWVKETWRAWKKWIGHAWDPIEPALVAPPSRPDAMRDQPEYRAVAFASDDGPWRSPVSMPHWASRLTLEVVSVRAERLQEISNADLLAEGLERLAGEAPADDPWDDFEVYYAQQFREFWDARWAKKGFGWDTNPWVWVREDRVVKEKS